MYLQFVAAHNDTGKLGEELACTYFEQRGYSILHKNWRHKNKEVDIIASQNNILHFIEVKAVTTLKYGHPEEKVNANKIKYLIDASAEFLFQNPEWQRIQFDVLSVTMLPGEEVKYFLIEDVYE